MGDADPVAPHVFDRPVGHEPKQALAGHADGSAASAVDSVVVATVDFVMSHDMMP